MMQRKYQVANYMNGGHYNPHHDYVMKEKAPDHVSYLVTVLFHVRIEVILLLFS